MSGVSFPADVDECDAVRPKSNSIALLAGIRARWIATCKTFPDVAIQWLITCKRVSFFEKSQPSTDRCGGSAGSKSNDFFRFPLNCRARVAQRAPTFAF
jgi:hypothetical protein